MNDLALFVVGVAVFTVTVMAVLWTGYLTFAKAAEADQLSVEPEVASRDLARSTLSDGDGEAKLT